MKNLVNVLNIGVFVDEKGSPHAPFNSGIVSGYVDRGEISRIRAVVGQYEKCGVGVPESYKYINELVDFAYLVRIQGKSEVLMPSNRVVVYKMNQALIPEIIWRKIDVSNVASPLGQFVSLISGEIGEVVDVAGDTWTILLKDMVEIKKSSSLFYSCKHMYAESRFIMSH